MSQGPDLGPARSDEPGRLDNGLLAAAYVPLTDVDLAMGKALLTLLGRAHIAAYLNPLTDESRRRLFVAAGERADARTIVATALRADAEGDTEPTPTTDDPLAGIDTDAAFAELVADWHVDTLAAIREAERQLRDEDEDWKARLNRPPVDDPVWLDDDHYVPPPPPPLPRLAPATVGAVLLLLGSIALLAFGSLLDLGSDVVYLLGVGGVLASAWMLVMRLRDRNDDDDDGAVV